MNQYNNNEDGLFCAVGPNVDVVGPYARTATKVADDSRLNDPLYGEFNWLLGVPGSYAGGDLLTAGPATPRHGKGLYCASANTPHVYQAKPLDQVNGTYAVRVKAASIVNGQEVCLFANQSGTDVTGYATRLQTDSAGSASIDFFRENAGVKTALAGPTAVTLTPGHVYELRYTRTAGVFAHSWADLGTEANPVDPSVATYATLFGGSVTDASPLNTPGYLGVRAHGAGTATTGLQCYGFSFNHPTLALDTLSAMTGRTVRVRVTGRNTAWASAPTFTVTGGTAASASVVSFDPVRQVLTLDITTGSSTGVLTLTDSAAAPNQATGYFFVRSLLDVAAPDATISDAFLYPAGAVSGPWVPLAVSGVTALYSYTGQGLQPSGGTGGYCAYRKPGAARLPGRDCQVLARITRSPTASHTVGVFLKAYTDRTGANMLFCVVRTNAQNTLEFYQIVGGVTSQVGASVNVTWADGDLLAVQCVGATATCLQNGVSVGTFAVPSLFQSVCGECGVRMSNSGEGLVSYFEAGPVPGTVALSWVGQGDVTDTTARIAFRCSGPATVTVQSTGANAFATPASATVTAGTDYTGKVDLAGLSAGTAYSAQVYVNGVLRRTLSVNTLVAAGTGLAGRKFAFGSCLSLDRLAVSEENTFANVQAGSPDFLLHLGDCVYADAWPVIDPKVEDYRAKYRDYFTSGTGTRNWAACREAVPTLFATSDHEFHDNYDRQQTDPYYAPAKQAYFESAWRGNMDPYRPGALYGTKVWGNVGFFLTDGRSYRSDNQAADDAGKTWLGAQQLADLKGWLLSNNASLRFKFVCCGESVSPHEGTGTDCPGLGFTTEIHALWDYIQASGITGVVFLSGDAHYSAVFKNSRNGMTFHDAMCSAFQQNGLAASGLSGTPADVAFWVDASTAGMSGFGGLYAEVVVTTSGAAGTGSAVVTVKKSDGTTMGSYTITESAVNAGLYAPTVITAQPAGQSLPAGGTLSVSLTATGTNLTYQWRKDGVNIAGATGASYSKAGAASADAGVYDCLVTGGAGSLTSRGVAVHVTARALPPSIF